MMLHEVYNITDQGMQRVLDSLAHPSMEYAVQQESLLRDSLSGMSCEQVGDSEELSLMIWICRLLIGSFLCKDCTSKHDGCVILFYVRVIRVF